MRATHPQATFADLEFSRQGIQLDPVLKQISDFIDQHAKLLEAVRLQLDKGLKKPQTGRNGLTASQVLRSFILMRVKNWDYRELAERIADGYTLRQFTHFYSDPVPKHDAFNRSHNRLTKVTVNLINEAVIKGANQAGLEDGEAIRSDTTVTDTDIHWPTDATLLWDTVRVLTRWMERLRKIVPHEVPRFSNQTRVARRRMLKLQRMTPAQRERHQTSTYKQLLAITEDVLDDARVAVEATKDSCGQTPTDVLAIAALRKQIADLCPLGDRVVDQTQRRIIDGEQVPADRKIYSIFEPHTDLIKRGKARKPVEFGHKVFLAETPQGLITQYQVLDGNPSDEDHIKDCLQRHHDTFGYFPDTLATDRGFDSAANQKLCQEAGIALVCIPQRGGKKTPARETFEKSPAFKKGQRFRAGIEGRISVLFRGRGMKRCLAEGKDGFELLVGMAVLANNLMRIAAMILENNKPRPRAA
jgi:IS5 family transposase